MMCFLLLSPSSQAQDARLSMREGLDHYEDGTYANAAEAFRAAAESADPEKLDPARASYNLGNALYRSGLLEEAQTAFKAATETTDRDVQARSFFNLGNTSFDRAQGLKEQQQLQPALEETDQALHHYRNAMKLDPSDRDPKLNFELATRFKKELEELQQQQQQEQEQEQEQDQESEDREQESGDREQESEDREQETGDREQESGDREQETGGEQQQQAPMPRPQEMTEEEARLLLDALKEDEQEQRAKLRLLESESVPVGKDW